MHYLVTEGAASQLPFGLEIDLDAIANMPTSAYTPSGYTVDEVRTMVFEFSAVLPITYLHICEGKTDGQSPQDINHVAKTIAYLVTDFMKMNDS